MIRAGAALLLAGCSAVAQRLPAPPLRPDVADSLRVELLRPGATYRFLYDPKGPWAIHVLEVDLDRCFSAVALKSGAGAVGREKTSALLRELGQRRAVIGGVNADFFLYTPPGVPTGLLVTEGRVVTGPSQQPVLAFDSSGSARVTTLRVAGSATLGGTRYAFSRWNRVAGNGLALFDGSWGSVLDTASAAVELVLDANRRVVRVDTLTAGAEVPEGGAVLVARPAELRAALLAARPGDSVAVQVALAPWHPQEAVGGRPVLLRDSALSAEVIQEDRAGFAIDRHPRTAAGIAREGKRLILLVVDGRQMPYSDGMTLRELAVRMLALGARDAINLDGGGSTTLVYVPRDAPETLRIANRPSDRSGERPVERAGNRRRVFPPLRRRDSLRR